MKLPDTIEACHELIKQLLVVMDGLQREVQELKDRLNQNSRNSHKPPSSDGLRKPALPPKSKGKRGGQAGHKGKTLKMVDRADETIELKPSVCLACRQDFGPGVEAVMEGRRQVFELPPTQGLSQLPESQQHSTLQKYDQLLKAGYAEEPPPQKNARGRPKKSKGLNLLERLDMHWQAVLAFAWNRNVHLAERDIRPAKSKLKVAGCFRTLDGAKAYARIHSFISVYS